MPQYSRRQVLGAAALAGGALGGGAVYGAWRAFGGEPPPRRSAEADLGRWQSLDAGRPILVALPPMDRTPFGTYLAEVLLAEGVNAFSLAPLDTAISHGLHRFGVVLLAAGDLAPAQVEEIGRYVTAGGRLVTMQPGDVLARNMGMQPLGRDVPSGDVLLAPAHPWTTSLTREAVRLHAPARPWRAGDADVLATVSSRDGGPSLPAVVHRRAGQGAVVLWSFDVAEAVVLARQGDPTLAATPSEHHRAADLFAGWVDPTTLDVPHADEHARLLVRVLTRLLEGVCPLPRLWYFPEQAPAVLVATGDAHESPASAVDDVLERVERYDGTMSIYYTPPVSVGLRRVYRHTRNWLRDMPAATRLANAREVIPRPGDVARWRARGHEFGLHVNVESGWEPAWDAAWRSFVGLRYGPVPPTTRTHRVAWHGWAAPAVFQAERGIRMNCDYYHFGDLLRDESGAWRYGYLTGSGLPARFADEGGRVLDILQQPTHLVDEHLMEAPWGGSGPRLNPDEAAAVSQEVLAMAARSTTPGAICAQFHVDPFATGGQWRVRFGAWLEATLSAARHLGIPVVSAERWLEALDTRLGTTLDRLHWDTRRGSLSLRATVPAGRGAAPTLLVPTRFDGWDLGGVHVEGVRVVVSDGVAEFARLQLPHGSSAIEIYYR